MMKVLKNHIKDLDFLDEDTRRTAVREIEELEEKGELDLGSSSTPNPSKPKPSKSTKSKPSKSKAIAEDVVSSSDSDEEPPKKVAALSSPPSKSTNNLNNNTTVNESPTTSTSEKSKEPKLVLRISKKNDRASQTHVVHSLCLCLGRVRESQRR